MSASAIARLTVAFLVAPLLGFVALVSGICALESEIPTLDLLSFGACVWYTFPFITTVGGLLAFPIALVAGVPLFVMFRRKRWLQWWQVAVGGLACGLIGMAPIMLMAASVQQWLLYVAYCVSVGAVAGFSFWLLGVYRNAL